MYESLLLKWKDEYLSIEGTYTNHVTKFVDYISLIGKANQPISITKEDVDNCIGHYNSLKKINTIRTMESHIESVKAFYKYLVGKKYCDDIFNNIASFQEFKEKIALKYKLLNPTNRSYWEDSELIDILELLEGYFNNNDLSQMEGINEKKKYFKFLVLRLFIKLTLVAPTKKSVICSMKFNNFEKGFKFLVVNGVRVKIPNSLVRDLKYSVKIAEIMKSTKANENDKIFDFVYNETFRVESLNEYFCTFLKTFKIFEIPDNVGSYPVEIIMDTALFEMVKNGANPALIAKINGTKISALEKKFYSNEIPIQDADELIYREIAKNKYYSFI
ncbi:hypothetical protein [Paenibacillus paeoniae]|uniref:Uncharacterized protein n=1 Tax=Paenibacillus paeoniae TaxID=2292705 RepID=A0A371PL94_9BACL|nr:hypothetical protein [Paenibacillus paeoniae]REK76419.1 hypothetical protein DX130_05090 [Paenibacillus paeoniae]